MQVVLAVNDRPIWVMPDEEVERIRTSLPDCTVSTAHTPEERRARFPEADVLVTVWMTEAEAALLSNVRWVHSTATGVGGLLWPALVDLGIPITSSRGLHAEAIAEHAIALALAVRRGLPRSAALQAARRWDQEAVFDLRTPTASKTTMLVIGLGAIGERIAVMARALGMRVVGVRRRPERGGPVAVEEVVGVGDLRQALARADVVVLAAPHAPGDGVLIGRDEIAAMRRSTVFVNVARGALVDETALADALARGAIAGAGLETFVTEPLPESSPFWTLPNVVITPHSASFETDYWGPTIDLFLDNMERFRRGLPLTNVVDPALGY